MSSVVESMMGRMVTVTINEMILKAIVDFNKDLAISNGVRDLANYLGNLACFLICLVIKYT